MTTAEDVLDLARSQLDVCENPMGSNSGTPYHAWYGPESQGWQWCAIFVDWLYWHTDPALIHGLKSAYSGDYLDGGREHGEEVGVEEAGPGDIVVFDWGDGGITDHIGIIEERLGPASFRTIEGNVGNCVGRQTRTFGGTCQMWFVRPQYQGGTPEGDEMALLGSGMKTSYFAATVNKADGQAWIKVYNPGPGSAGAHIGATGPNNSQDVTLAAGERVVIGSDALGVTGESEIVVTTTAPVVVTIKQ